MDQAGTAGDIRRDCLPGWQAMHRAVAQIALQLTGGMSCQPRDAIAGAVLAWLATLTPVNAQDARDRTVDQYQCRDVIRESGANRDAAIAFLHAFLLGKSGRQQFRLDDLHAQSEAFIERCLNSPTERAVDAMAALKR